MFPLPQTCMKTCHLSASSFAFSPLHFLSYAGGILWILWLISIRKKKLILRVILLESSKLTAMTRSTVSFSAKRGHRERALPSSLFDVFFCLLEFTRFLRGGTQWHSSGGNATTQRSSWTLLVTLPVNAFPLWRARYYYFLKSRSDRITLTSLNIPAAIPCHLIESRIITNFCWEG